MSKKVVIATVALKGGVGKSTTSNLLQSSTINPSIIINTDDQDANSSNASEAINLYALAEDGIDLKTAIDGCLEDFDTVIVDTPGEVVGPVADMIEYTRNFIVPVVPGNRSVDYTKQTIDVLMDLYDQDKKPKICFIVNNFADEEERAEVQKAIEDHIQVYTDKMKYTFTKLNHSKTIRTMENKRASIAKLSKTNRVAYNVAKKRIDAMTAEVKTFFGVE